MLMLSSPDLTPGEPMPRRFTCDGQDVSPAFRWTGVPQDTRELLLVCEDPDAFKGTFMHWAAYGISPDRDYLHAGYEAAADAPGFHQAVNDFGHAGYGGPCPPKGDTAHSFHFRLSALDAPITGAGPETTCREIIAMAQPHVIESAEIVASYVRMRPNEVEHGEVRT